MNTPPAPCTLARKWSPGLGKGHLYKEVGQAGEQIFVRTPGHAVLRIVQHLAPERLAEVQGLQHRVGVAGVAEVLQPKVALRLCVISAQAQQQHVQGWQ